MRAEGVFSARIPLIILLGVVTAFDAMAIDMYLPAMGEIGHSLNADIGTMQSSLSVFLLGLAVGQLVYGPLSDRYGRRKPLMIGISIFTLASVILSLSQDTPMFMLGRALQGVGGAAGLVIPRAVVADMFSSRESAKIFSLLMQIMMIGPIAAPPVGGLLLSMWGWHSVFWVLALIGIVTIIAMVRVMPETLSNDAKKHDVWNAALTSYSLLLRQRRFFALALSGSFTMAGLFLYIGASSFIFAEHFGLPPTTYSLVFALNAIGMIAFGQINILLLNRWSTGTLLSFGLLTHAAFVLLLTVAVVSGVDELWSISVLIFLSVVSLSLIFGNITAQVMESAPDNAGAASSLFGVMGYVLASIAGAVLSHFHNGTLFPVAGLMLVCALMAWILQQIARLAPHTVPAE